MDTLEPQSAVPDTSMMLLRQQLGYILLQERLSQKKEAVDVARRLMLSKQQLLAIESGESGSFHHERRYVQGTKSYVFYLGLQNRLDVESFLKQIEEEAVQGARTTPAAGVAQLHRSAAAPASIKTYSPRRSRYVYVGLGLLVLGAVALAISEGWPFKDNTTEILTSESTQDSPLNVSSDVSANAPSAPSAPTVPTPLTTTSAPLAALPSVTDTVASSSSALPVSAIEKNSPAVNADGRAMMRIDFNADCWLSVQTVEGKKIDRIYKQGESFSIPLANVSALTLGNAPAAQIFLADRQVNVMTKEFTQGNVARLDQKNLQFLQKNAVR